jgi:hypothetical protein
MYEIHIGFRLCLDHRFQADRLGVELETNQRAIRACAASGLFRTCDSQSAGGYVTVARAAADLFA